MHSHVDVAVVGGGAGGLSAALVLARARRRVVVIDGGRPRNGPASHLHGFLTRDHTPPSELVAHGRREVTGYGGHLLDAEVIDVADGGGGFHLRLSDDRTLTARRLLVATGLSDHLPDVQGLSSRWGHDVLHCPYCHGYEVADQPLGVLDDGASAVERAATVRTWSSDLVLFTNGATLDADARATLAALAIEVVTTPVDRLVVADDALTGVRLADGRLIERSALFVATTPIPNDGLLRGLGATTHDHPAGRFVTTDERGRTSVEGVWAVGNVIDPRAQLITAAGDGSRAAIDIDADLVRDDVAQHLTARPPPGPPAAVVRRP